MSPPPFVYQDDRQVVISDALLISEELEKFIHSLEIKRRLQRILETMPIATNKTAMPKGMKKMSCLENGFKGKLIVEIMVLLAIALLFIPFTNAVTWTGSVNTTYDYWSITRQSQNLSFSNDEYVKATVSAIHGPKGRILGSYSSYFENINLDDVKSKERIAAHEGYYSFEELSNVYSAVSPITLTIDKPAGTDIYTINFEENWPVWLNASRSIQYSGKSINDREFAGNDLNFVKSDMLYNKEFTKDLVEKMSLTGMNATILANDDHIFSAERDANMSLNLNLTAHTSGIADMKYLRSGPQYRAGPTPRYQVLSEGEDRYVGVFDITKRFQMKSVFCSYNTSSDDWLPCSCLGWDSMPIHDQRYHSAKDFFDCTSCLPPAPCAP